jgi:two-component system sensor kinase FixL
MASALAHELNQPLTALRNFSAVALRRLEEPESGGEAIRGPLKMIAEQALRAGEIVHRVRGFVRKGAGDGPRGPERGRSGHGALCRIRRPCPLRPVRPRTGRALHPVLADQVQLEQVIGNLVKNGIEAMGESTGERVLTIRTRPLDDGTVGVCVIDRGGGLADAVRADPLRPLSPPSPMASVSACHLPHHRREPWRANVGRISTSSGTTFSFCLPVVAV